MTEILIIAINKAGGLSRCREAKYQHLCDKEVYIRQEADAPFDGSDRYMMDIDAS